MEIAALVGLPPSGSLTAVNIDDSCIETTLDCPDIEMGRLKVYEVYVKGGRDSVIMARIEHTNLVVDDFSIAKRDPQRVYTHVLSHVHTGTHSSTTRPSQGTPRWLELRSHLLHAPHGSPAPAPLPLSQLPRTSLLIQHCLDYGQPTVVGMS